MAESIVEGRKASRVDNGRIKIWTRQEKRNNVGKATASSVVERRSSVFDSAGVDVQIGAGEKDLDDLTKPTKTGEEKGRVIVVDPDIDIHLWVIHQDLDNLGDVFRNGHV